ncbi:N-acetylglucosamine kinase [Pragia fontium]|uniref:N-acetyl-D-glucosamine kinase n=2 Tax=Pragia fontium TaxID=82985 RepID=A0AAJ5BHI3_9GAMM|nr:N-acetylglucosamine kinase [Pragia fontium]AKJ42225.1 N-acetylglucosamine kinase [Pragia fontium]GKX61712.1 N-acetyl-D-glucosamine kinase [Pragia fontium]SFC96812.1 N-acetylglucosamine kinase [Pragia fontium DSM 5563 = ATCC 49100]VEJ55394.1 N-acetyl-D-glucosamine kinase [Pragia fontium]
MFYGFDMGGTKIELAVFDEHLKQLWQKRVPTPKDDYQALLQTFTELTLEADQRFNSKGKVGVGIPGIVNAKQGTVFTTNVPAAKHKPLVADLTHCLQRPVRIDNDANCFALSEAWDTEFRQYPTVLGMILGTGVGGGFVVDGKVISGKNGIAGEIGHLNLTTAAANVLTNKVPEIVCGCGKTGCFEGYLSGPGFERIYSCFYHEKLSAVKIIENYYAGDDAAKVHVERYVTVLSMYLGNILTLFDPHLLVIGGGLSQFDEIYRLLPEYLPQYLYGIATLPQIEKARYGDAGGARGAACLNLLD